MTQSIIDRFMDKVSPEPNSGCWLWTGASTKSGYGRFLKTTAHRVSYRLFVGPFPESYDIDHLCRVRCCVNPQHLEAVTREENLLRSPHTFSSLHLKKTHCPQGHPYRGNNLYIHERTGHRQCRKCRSYYSRNRKSRRTDNGERQSSL